ncbi:MAG: fumarate hydratase C-terminal domain-containing protein [Elusimicrobiota bacterium]|nr:fumarate hydratase C-terminal domain-containing protein [Elusimicrobiota bacterium]
MKTPGTIVLPLARPQKPRAGDFFLLNGLLGVARDRTLKKFFDSHRKSFPGDKAVFYCGPIIRNGKVTASGPTTSSRMDWAIDKILKTGVNVIIGKGSLSSAGSRILKKRGVYFEAPGGAGALLASCVTAHRTVSFSELGAQALRLFEVRDFPVIVSQDYEGRHIWGKKS